MLLAAAATVVYRLYTIADDNVWHQARGLLNIVQARPLPPFEKWSFTEKRYIQYMCDQQNVHYALEAAIAEAIAVGPSGPHQTNGYQPSDICAAAFKAVACFGESAGLDRYRLHWFCLSSELLL